MLDLIVEFSPWDLILCKEQEKMKFVFNYTRVIGCCLIPLGICGLKNNSRRITFGLGCVWGMPSLSPLSSLASTNNI